MMTPTYVFARKNKKASKIYATLFSTNLSTPNSDLWAPDIIVHAGGNNSVARDWGEIGTGDTARVTAEFTDYLIVCSFQAAQVIYMH